MCAVSRISTVAPRMIFCCVITSTSRRRSAEKFSVDRALAPVGPTLIASRSEWCSERNLFQYTRSRYNCVHRTYNCRLIVRNFQYSVWWRGRGSYRDDLNVHGRFCSSLSFSVSVCVSSRCAGQAFSGERTCHSRFFGRWISMHPKSRI